MFVVLCMSTMMWGASSSVPENAPDVMLQAFYWDSYPSNSSNLGYGNTGWSALLNQADELGEYFDLVWLPPCSQSSGGTGYIPKQYSNLNSDWGSETQLRELISKLKAKNTRCVADIVVNHITGNYGWCSFATMDFGDYGVFNPDASWICQTDEMNYEASAGTCQGKATGANDDGYGDEANYTAARDWDHKNSQVQAMCRAYLKWLKNDVGFDGWRYDYGKGFHHSHINDYNSAAGAYMSVVEYWDGNPGVIRSRLEDAQWNNMAFDFGTKYDAINNGICSFNYGKCKGAGMLGAGLSKHAVTFVDNHDTFQRNNSEFGGQGNSMLSNFKDRLLQANAYILSMPGIPCVFYPHWVTYKSEIKAMIEARHLVGVHSQSEVKDEYAEEGGYQVTVVGSKGYLILQLGNKVGGSFDGFTKKASGNGYAMWILTNTPVEHTYTVAGNSADVFGTAWAPSFEANDMIKQDDGSYKWEKSDLVLKAGTIELKVCEDHGWDVSYPAENYQLKIDAAGTYTITITFNAETKAISATATKTADADPGDEPGDDPQPAEKDSIFLVNAKAWATPTVHLWGGTAAGTTWPGVAMTKVNEKINGYDVYKYVADKGAYKNCIFNNAGADQTADLDWTSGKYYYVDKWYAKEDIPSSGDPGSGDDPQPAEKDSIFLVNAKTWATPTVHLWGGTAAGTTWPGVAMTKVSEKINGYDVYKYVADKGAYKNCIFNNAGADQTADLDWTSGKYYYIDKWYAKEDIPASEDPGSGDDPQPGAVKFYITGDSALVVDAGLDKAKAWNPAAIKSETDTFELSLKADQYYVLKVTLNGTWEGENNVKGYNELTEKTEGLDDVSNDHNIGFKLSEAGKVQVIYTTDKDNKTIFKLVGKFVTEGSGSGDDPQPGAAKFYITGDSALVVDAGLEKAKAWNADAIKSEVDTFELSLKADQYYVLKVTLNGTWEGENNVKGYNELTEKTEGLDDVSNDHNIGFKLSEAGKVQVIYTTDKDNKTIFKLAGKFVTEGSGSGDDPQPGTKYFMKNNWNGGAEWSWKEMTAAENNTFKLEKVVFGGTGVNYNTAESDEGAEWVAVDAFAGDEIGALDTVTFVLDLAAEKKVKAILLGKYNEGQGGGDDPQPGENVTVYFVNNVNWEAVNAYVWVGEGDAYKQWPGEALTKETAQAGVAKREAEQYQGYDIYSYTFPSKYVNIIFNNGSVQTVDLTWNTVKPYFYPDGAEGSKVKGTWYAKEEIPSEGEPIVKPEDGYYLLGTFNSWTPAAEYLFKVNPDKANEYYLSVTLAVDDKLKVAKVEDGAAKTWYPDGMDNDYVVDAAHAGAKVIYFQTTYNAEWEAFGGYFYIASDTGTGLDNSQAGATYQKFIENGQLFILRDGRIYTPAGQFVR